MKPISEQTDLRSRKTFPLLDYAFQTTTNSSAASTVDSTVANNKAPAAHRLWKVSADFCAGESLRDKVVDLFVFAAMAVTAACPVFFALHSITRMVRGY